MSLPAAWASDAQARVMPELAVAAMLVVAAGVIHCDSSGVVPAAGDTAVLSKDLPVKDASFTAKCGGVLWWRTTRAITRDASRVSGS